jgi:protein phosphatase
LAPVAVDPSSGYRYYDVAQISDALAVAFLRRAGVPVSEVTSFMRSPSMDRLTEWESRLNDQGRQRTEALALAHQHFGFDGVDPAPTTGGNSMTRLKAAFASSKGAVRHSNQDAVLADEALFAVADGMGERGEVASALASRPPSGLSPNPPGLQHDAI